MEGLQKGPETRLKFVVRKCKKKFKHLKLEIPQKCLAVLGARSSLSHHAWAILSSDAVYGQGGLATLHRKLVKVPVCSSYHEGFRCCRELLPISPTMAKSWWKCIFRSGSGAVCPLTLIAARSMLSGLNFLMCTGWSNDPIVPEAFGPLRPEQHSLLYNIWERVLDLRSGPDPDFPLFKRSPS